MAAQIMRVGSVGSTPPSSGPGHDFNRISIHSPSALNSAGTRGGSGVLRRKCSCGGTCSECRKRTEDGESASLRRKAAGPESSIAGSMEAPASVHQVLSSPGQPLDRTTRAFMEPRFGYDFSRVRVHTDAEAARSAEQVNARAYAVGDHLVFAGGLFAPRSGAGTQLLAHELAHVVQAGGGTGGATLRRAPAGGTPPPPPSEASLRVSIMDTLEAAKRTAVADLADAIVRGDQAYLSGLGLSSKQVTSLLNHDAQFSMTFGNAAETSLEAAIRANPLLNQHVVRGPTGRVARGVGKPDWRIETPSSSIPVDLMTPGQVEAKLSMWRRSSRRGKPKWYIEKAGNITYDRDAAMAQARANQAAGGNAANQPAGANTANQPAAPDAANTPAAGDVANAPAAGDVASAPAADVAAAPAVGDAARTTTGLGDAAKVGTGAKLGEEVAGGIAAGSKIEGAGLRAAGRFLAREVPFELLQVAIMLVVFPGVNAHNEKLEELSEKKLYPPIQDRLNKLDPTIQKMIDNAPETTLYSNVTVELDYKVVADDSRDLPLYLEDVKFIDLKLSNNDVTELDEKFNKTDKLKVSKRVTYSIRLFEAADVEFARKQKEYAACVQKFGPGYIPPAAGAEALQEAIGNPDEHPCIEPKMRAMEGP